MIVLYFFKFRMEAKFKANEGYFVLPLVISFLLLFLIGCPSILLHFWLPQVALSHAVAYLNYLLVSIFTVIACDADALGVQYEYTATTLGVAERLP